MNAVLFRFCVLAVAGWVHRSQLSAIEYLLAENRVLRERLGDQRQRRRLAVRAKAVGRAGLQGIASLVTPDTLLRWYRKLVASKYDGSDHRGPDHYAPRRRLQIPLGEILFRLIVAEYVEHYHRERNHQGLGNRLIDEPMACQASAGRVQCRKRLGGTLRFYHRDAA